MATKHAMQYQWLEKQDPNAIAASFRANESTHTFTARQLMAEIVCRWNGLVQTMGSAHKNKYDLPEGMEWLLDPKTREKKFNELGRWGSIPCAQQTSKPAASQKTDQTTAPCY
jgi:hypothetical protein